jgi:hypothetical protein
LSATFGWYDKIQIEHVDGRMRRLARDPDARNRIQTALDTLSEAATMLTEVAG